MGCNQSMNTVGTDPDQQPQSKAKQNVKYVRSPTSIECESFSIDETCDSLAGTLEGVPMFGGALATTVKAVGWMISCFQQSSELSENMLILKSKVVQIRDVLHEQVENQMVDGQIESLTTVYQQELENAVTVLYNWMVNKLEQLDKKGNWIQKVKIFIASKKLNNEVETQHDKIDAALGKYILMKMFDRLEDPMPNAIKEKYKSTPGYAFWVNNFKDDKTVKKQLFGEMLHFCNQETPKTVVTQITNGMDFDFSGCIDLVEFFRFMFIYSKYFKQVKKKLLIMDEKGLAAEMQNRGIALNDNQALNVQVQSQNTGQLQKQSTQQQQQQQQMNALNDKGILELGDDFIKYSNGATYEGDILDEKREGYGTYTYQNYSYEGNWSNDLKHGEGIEKKGKQIFEGMFQKNEKKSGITTYANGYVYNGGYLKNMRDGFGKLEMPKNRQKEYVEGMWKDDDIYYGTIKMRDGNYYNGQMRATIMKHGNGIIYDSKFRILEIAKYEDDFIISGSIDTLQLQKCRNCNEYGYQREYCCVKCQIQKGHDEFCRSNTCGLDVIDTSLQYPKGKALQIPESSKYDCANEKKANPQLANLLDYIYWQFLMKDAGCAEKITKLNGAIIIKGCAVLQCSHGKYTEGNECNAVKFKDNNGMSIHSVVKIYKDGTVSFNQNKDLVVGVNEQNHGKLLLVKVNDPRRIRFQLK